MIVSVPVSHINYIIAVQSTLPEVGEFVHEAVKQGGASLAVHSELPPLSEVVRLLDVLGVLPLRNTHLTQIVI